MKRALLVVLLALSCTRDESTGQAASPSSPPGPAKRLGVGRGISGDGQPTVRDAFKVVPPAVVEDAGSP